jgi:signal transduction histidine kinase
MKYFKRGYHLDGNDAYLIITLPKNRYFNAKYLVIKNKLSFAVIYEKVALILFAVFILVFMLSIFFLNHFARPFQRLNKTLDNFIKDSMHEINTPLSIISVNIDLYNRKNEPNKYMNRMKAATKVLSNIYNDMDYLIKHDRVDYEVQSINMTAFINERVEYFSEVALITIYLMLLSTLMRRVVLRWHSILKMMPAVSLLKIMVSV